MPHDIAPYRELPFFADLSDDNLAPIAALAAPRTMQRGEVLFRRGEEADCLFILVSGRIALQSGREEDDPGLIEVVEPVDAFVLASVLLERPYLVTAMAIDDGALLCVPAEALRTALRRNPALAAGMLISLAKQYRRLVRHVSDLKRRSAAQRLGCYLLGLAKERAGSASIQLPFEKRLLASRLGMTPEHLSRAFATLRSCGVTTRGVRVHMADLDTLARFARPDEGE
jgi:CRP/FNR family transcriptional activator FtrB